MAAKRVKNPPSPSKLTMSLFAPGMTLLHRAGLGGLACTLAYIERAYRAGVLQDDEVPGGPWTDDAPPWTIDAQMVSLDFKTPEGAGEYLKRLFAVAFDIKDGLIYLPGQYEQEPSLAVRAELQSGLTLTFLQHGLVRGLAREATVFQHDPVGDGMCFVNIEFKKCSSFKHQSGWKKLVDNDGCLHGKPVAVMGPLNPGAVVRHVAFTAGTTVVESCPTILPLYFSLVGCLTLSVNRGSGVLVVPDVQDLLAFCTLRPWMTPTTDRECQIAGAGDAALQAQLRVRMRRMVEGHDLPGCFASEFRPTPWASQQKSRVRTVSVSSGDQSHLDQFEVAMAELPPRIASRTVTETAGKGRQKQKSSRTEWFWADSVVRPLVADNLACGQPWYGGFVRLMTQLDPVSKKPIRNRLFFEKKGLHAMIEKIPWQDQGEGTVVKAVHEAIRRRYGQISEECKGKPAAMKNRWKGEYDRWRLAFAGAKTPGQFRRCLCDLFSRAGVNAVLQEQWPQVLPMLSDEHWQFTRDLALLALASYVGKGAREIEEAGEEQNEKTQ